jgi:hypothetical protein
MLEPGYALATLLTARHQRRETVTPTTIQSALRHDDRRDRMRPFGMRGNHGMVVGLD